DAEGSIGTDGHTPSHGRQAVAMPAAGRNRRVVVLAPMPLELDAIVAAFGLKPDGESPSTRFTGGVGGSDVTAIHIGMGPPATRAATAKLLDAASDDAPVDHVMIA